MNSANKLLTSSIDLLERAISYVKTGTGLEDRIRKVVGLDLPLGDAADERVRQVEHIVGLLERYHADACAERPLSIAVFGPPGSGKSTFVKRITEAVVGCRLETPANLTQISGTADLSLIFKPTSDATAAGQGSTEPAETPVYFFDEFDAALDGAPLGWLSWFLAPMQDGVVRVAGEPVEVRKAVFVFAGGTAETLDEFNQRAQLDPEAYRARKVPDFVSRLRGSIDIGGVNGLGDACIVPRALVLRRLLEKRAVPLDDRRIGQLLSHGHFVHGVRSMITLLDAEWSEADGPDLPGAIRGQHFSHGKLDGQLIGISAGLKETGAEPMFAALTKQLLRSGAALAYGGAFEPKGTLEKVLEAVREAPKELVRGNHQRPRVHNYLGYPASLQEKPQLSEEESKSVKFMSIKTISKEELEGLGAPTDQWFEAIPQDSTQAYDPRRHVAWALSLFRLRVRMLQDIRALVVLGGKDDGQSWGRMAGIAEEVMIALALNKPVFVLGGAGGAAQAVGQLLGLDGAPVGLGQCLEPPALEVLGHALVPYAPNFMIPGEPDSPRDLDELRYFLFHRGVTTEAWPWNGLSPGDNRALFACPISEGAMSVERAVELILQGLSRIDWKPVRGEQEALR